MVAVLLGIELQLAVCSVDDVEMLHHIALKSLCCVRLRALHLVGMCGYLYSGETEVM